MAEEKVYTMVSVEFPSGVRDFPVEMPGGLNKEESRVFALGASQGILTLIKMAIGEENLEVQTTAWDESNLPEDGTMGLNTK